MCRQTKNARVSLSPRRCRLAGDQVCYDDLATDAHCKHHHHNRHSSPTAISTDVSSMSVDSYQCTYPTPTHIHPTSTTSITGCYKNVHHYYDISTTTIGNGYYGSVREAFAYQTRNTVAIKSIDKVSQSAEQLRREVSLLQSVNHPSIMKLIDVCEDDQYVHIVTEKYSGGELFDKIMNQGSGLQEAEACRIIYSLLSAVDHLHRRDIVHRDIKPENVMFVSSEEGSGVKLIDFGLARKHDSRREAPMCNPVGSAYYMAPELLQRCYGKSCDIWTLGVVAYVLLCGYPPFNGFSDKEIFDRILTGELHFEPERWYGVSEEAKDFVRCLLQRDTRLRPRSDLAMLHPWFLCQKRS